MAADRRTSDGLVETEIGSLIAIMLVGVLMSIIVALTVTPNDARSDAGSGRAEAVWASESWGDVAPAIAEVDLGITTEA